MNIMFSMLISSNALFLLFIVFEYAKKDFFSQKQRYAILKASLCMLFIPIAYLKYILLLLFDWLYPVYGKTDLFIKGNLPAIMRTPQETYVNTPYRIHMLIIIVWLSMALLIFCYNAWKYIKFRKYICNMIHEIFSPEILNIVNNYRAHLHIKRFIRVYSTSLIDTPFTTGILRPIIVIPETKEIEKQRLMIHHELCHIKSHDGFIRFLRTIIVGIYWFNPLIFLFDGYLSKTCEFACDEQVARSLDKAEKKNYCYLIIEAATSAVGNSIVYVTPFSDNKTIIKERIYLIMDNRKRTNKLSFLITAGMIVCSSFTAFAYTEPQSLVWEIQPQDDVFIHDSSEMATFTHSGGGNIYFKNQRIIYDSQFTDIYGNVFSIEEIPGERKKCEHTYVDGTYDKHTKNSNGSCITKSYSAQRCSKCKVLKLGTLISEVKYTKCPH